MKWSVAVMKQLLANRKGRAPEFTVQPHQFLENPSCTRSTARRSRFLITFTDFKQHDASRLYMRGPLGTGRSSRCLQAAVGSHPRQTSSARGQHRKINSRPIAHFKVDSGSNLHVIRLWDESGRPVGSRWGEHENSRIPFLF